MDKIVTIKDIVSKDQVDVFVQNLYNYANELSDSETANHWLHNMNDSHFEILREHVIKGFEESGLAPMLPRTEENDEELCFACGTEKDADGRCKCTNNDAF